jgi:hypothetical protein
LGEGDHFFIKVTSFAFYAGMRCFDAASLKKHVDDGFVLYKGLVDETVFALICKGVEDSRYSALKYQLYFAAQSKSKSQKK